mmetsp:Transcript_33390/g.86265  ORF Transcript_33390/g.86265 Transcript_33390/m.86265 type:complete len:211 (+) Transcript_33390:686-1318(+)
MVFQDAGARLHELLNRGLREVFAVGLGDAPIDLPQQLARLLLGLREAVEEVHLAREGVEEGIQPSADEPLARHLADIEILGDGVIPWNRVPTFDGRPILLSRQRSLVCSLRHTSLAGKGTFIEFDDYVVLEVVPALNLARLLFGRTSAPNHTCQISGTSRVEQALRQGQLALAEQARRHCCHSGGAFCATLLGRHGRGAGHGCSSERKRC